MQRIVLATIYLLLLAICACKNERYYAYDHYPKFSDSLEWQDGPYKLYGLNRFYFIESLPYDPIYSTYCEHCAGITHVYSISKRRLYTISRYFKPDHVFLSRDGRSILYFNDNCSDSTWDECPTDLVQHYTDGKLTIAYPVNSFGHDPIKEGYWLYNEENSWLANNHLYAVGDTVYAITRKKQVFRFNISSGRLVDSIHIEQYLKNRKYLTYPDSIIRRFKTVSTKDLPILEDSSTIYSSLGRYLNAEVLTMEDEQFSLRKYYKFNISAIVGNNGRVRSLEIDVLENILLTEAHALKTKIDMFLRAQKFLPNAVPYHQKEWKFNELIFVQKLPISLAEKEFAMYRDSICRLNSAEGIYIPSNLDEAINELDRLLSDAKKQQVRSGENMQSSLGMTIRNNWRLWSGSRLSCYFNRKRLYHPELMSAVILEAYLKHLQGIGYSEDSLIKAANIDQEKNLPCYQ